MGARKEGERVRRGGMQRGTHARNGRRGQWREYPVIARIPGFKLVLTDGGPAVHADYPPEFEQSKAAVRKRANKRCERCGLREGETYIAREPDADGNPVTMVQKSLQVAHLTQDPMRCGVDELQAICNRCHGHLDKRHRWGISACTQAMWRTLTHERFELVLTRAKAGVHETGTIEPGEVELVIARGLAVHGAVGMTSGVELVRRFCAPVVVPEETAREYVALALRKAELRGMARREGWQMVYALGRPLWIDEAEEEAA